MRRGTEVDVVTSVAELVSLRQRWNELSADFATPLLDHDWCVAAAESLHQDDEIRVVVIRQGGSVTAIAPMVADRRVRGRLAVLGSSTLYEPGGWLYTSLDALTQLTRAVLRIGLPTVLQRYPAHSTLATQLPRLMRGRGLWVCRPAPSTFAVDVRDLQLSRRGIRTLKPLWSRVHEVYTDVSFTQEETPVKAVDDALMAFETVEGSGWKGRAGSSLSSRPDLRRFFRMYLTSAAARGRMIVSTLKLDGATAAMELAVRAYGRLWQLKTGYDERFSAIYPGLLLTDAVVEQLGQARMEGYEFLGSTERWQKRWSTVRREYRMAALYPLSTHGLCAILADGVRYGRRRVSPARLRFGVSDAVST